MTHQIVIVCDSERDFGSTVSILGAGKVHGIEAGAIVEINKKPYRVTTASQYQSTLVPEQVIRQTIPETQRSKPVFGSDRPYLRRKKGRS